MKNGKSVILQANQNSHNHPRKNKFLVISFYLPILALTSCEDEQTTTVSNSLFGDNTIVSRSNSSGSYTRTEYGSDFFGNKTIKVSRGHENATEGGDLADFLIKAAVNWVVAVTDR